MSWTKQGLHSAKGPFPFLGNSYGFALASLPFPHTVGIHPHMLMHTSGARHQLVGIASHSQVTDSHSKPGHSLVLEPGSS